MTRKQQEGETVGIREVHRILGADQISRGALYEAVKRGEIPAIRLGGRILVPRTWLTAKLKGIELSAGESTK
jgi:excisionase family DNA binding protein